MKLETRRGLIVLGVIAVTILAYDNLGHDVGEKAKIAFGALIICWVFAMGFWSPKPTKEEEKRERDLRRAETEVWLEHNARLRNEMAEEKEERVRRHMAREADRRAATRR